MNYFSILLAEQEYTEMPAPLGFENWLTFWMVIACSLTNVILMIFSAYKFLHILQLSSYKMKGYFGWIKEDKGSQWGRLIMLSFLSCAALLITNVLLEDFFVYKIMTYFGLIFYVIFCIIYIVNQYSNPQKTELKYTNRMTRLVVVFSVLVFIITMLLLNLSFLYIPYFKFGAIGLIPMFIPLLICISFYITYPFEIWNNKRFVRKAQFRLEQRKDLIKIGITGSFGKTSVKNILATLLSKKYKVCHSPQSYNTPLGISKTVLNHMKDSDEIFIAEMGARYTGDIKELCDIVKPEIGIITGIGNQHLLTFGSEENLIKTKGELVDFVSAANGKMFFNGDCEKCSILLDNCKCDCVISNPFVKNANLYAKDIIYNARGTEFSLVYQDKVYKTHTALLGKHNISNIILCVEVCLSLGLSIQDIVAGIELLVPSSHRLAIVPSTNSLIVIDDAYNASVEGSRAALEVLKSYKSTKIVITPGLVELGNMQYQSNKELGEALASCADYVIINGTTNYDALYAGLKAGNMKEENILRSGSLKQATTLLADISKPGDVVLFENDLPDNYS